MVLNNQLTINQHSENLQKHFKFKVSQDSNVWLTIYWIRKLHKNSEKARFIIESSISSLKPLTISLTSVFKAVFQIVQNRSNKCRYFTGVNTFCTVLNNEAVITKQTWQD